MQFDWSDAVTARAGVRWNRTQVYPSVEARSVPMRHVAYAFIGSQFAPLRNATRRAVQRRIVNRALCTKKYKKLWRYLPITDTLDMKISQ